MYTIEKRIAYSDVDKNEQLTLTGIIDCLQDCCTLQSEDYEVGVSYLNSVGMGWYLASWNIKLYEVPKLGDTIRISTWPYLFRGMIGYRNFTVESTDGKRLLDADSVWLMMNLEKQIPARLPQKVEEAYAHMDPPLELSMSERKLPLCEGHTAVYDFEIMRMHLDTNHHMNNGRYIEATSEVLPENFVCTGIRAEYKKPAWYGDKITVTSAKCDFGYQSTLRLLGTDDILAIVDFIGK